MEYPKSEKTIIKHKFFYKGVRYINDIGFGEIYRIVINNKDTKKRVQYYKGKLLQEFEVM